MLLACSSLYLPVTVVALQTLHHRLDQLECVRLPGMETRIQHALEAPLSQVATCS